MTHTYTTSNSAGTTSTLVTSTSRIANASADYIEFVPLETAAQQQQQQQQQELHHEQLYAAKNSNVNATRTHAILQWLNSLSRARFLCIMCIFTVFGIVFNFSGFINQVVSNDNFQQWLLKRLNLSSLIVLQDDINNNNNNISSTVGN